MIFNWRSKYLMIVIDNQTLRPSYRSKSPAAADGPPSARYEANVRIDRIIRIVRIVRIVSDN